MNEKYIERNQQTEDFEVKHRDFFEKLKYMPTDKKDERWKFFNKYDQREKFIVELIEVYRPGAYSKIRDRLEKLDEETSKKDKDSDVAYWGKKEIDSVVFMEVIKDAIEIYTGKNRKGEEYGFVACVGMLYKQKASVTAAENSLRQKGITDQEIAKRNLPNILKLAKAAERVWVRNFEKKPKEEALKQAIEEASYHCTKKEMELVKALFLLDSIVVSVDMPLEIKDGETGSTFADQLKDEKDYFEAVIEQGTDSFLEVFCQKIEEGWEIITSAKGLKEQELIKIFLTQGILKELKLDENGKPYLKEPAGDEEFYHILRPKGAFLYHRLFFKNYLWRAFVEKPEDFYTVYSQLLRKDFNFSDKIIAEVLGKDKTAISKGKRHYYNLMKAICNCCMTKGA